MRNLREGSLGRLDSARGTRRAELDASLTKVGQAAAGGPQDAVTTRSSWGSDRAIEQLDTKQKADSDGSNHDDC
jgi:hypothetical protein